MARNDFLSPHMRAQRLRDRHRAVGVLVVLQDRDEAAGGRHGRRVQRVRNELVSADLARPDVQPARLVVRAVAAADHLAVGLLPREPSFDIVLLRGDGADVARADIHRAVRNLQGAVDPLSVRAELLLPRRALLRTAEDELFDLVELVHAEEALRVDAVGPDLPAELGRQAGEAEGQLAVVDHLVHVHRADGMLRRRDQVQVLALDLVHDALEVAEVHDPFVGGPAHHERREDGREALLDHEREGEGEERLVQSDEVSHQVNEARPRDFPRSLEVRELQGLQQLSVGPQLVVEGSRGAPAGDLHVLRVVLADGDALVEEVGEAHQPVSDLRGEVVDLAVEGLDFLRERRGLLPEFVRALPRLLRGGDLLRDFVPPALQAVPLGERLPPSPIPPDHVLEELLLVRVATLHEVLADHLGILPDEPDVEHGADTMWRSLFVGYSEGVAHIISSRISRISRPRAFIESLTRPRFSSAGRTHVRVYPPPSNWTRTRQPPASIRISSGSGRFRLEVTFVAADSARVAIAVVVSEVRPRNVDTIGRPNRSPTTRARTPPISAARDSSVCVSPPSVEMEFRSIDPSIVRASFPSMARIVSAMKMVLTRGADKAPRQLHLTAVGRRRAGLLSRSKPRL